MKSGEEEIHIDFVSTGAGEFVLSYIFNTFKGVKK